MQPVYQVTPKDQVKPVVRRDEEEGSVSLLLAGALLLPVAVPLVRLQVVQALGMALAEAT